MTAGSIAKDEANPLIPFNKPYLTGRELTYIAQAHINGQLAGDGPFTAKCHRWLEETLGCARALLTHSCTAALEMAAILADIQEGDEVILPSFTFVSTANAFVLRGGVPVFIDIRPDTLNIDEARIEAAITLRTKAIVPVHYAGVMAEMGAIMRIADAHKLIVIEDAAQAILSGGKTVQGHMSTLSFHETKNVISGEGGALLIRDEALVARAEIIREKGTNRSQFQRGEVSKYRWVDIGSSFLPGEITAAFLYAQLEEANNIIARRRAIWQTYHARLEALEAAGHIRRPAMPDDAAHNAHLYYILVNDAETRPRLIAWLKERNIYAVFHYVPLHSSPAGAAYGRAHGSMEVTDAVSARLLRLPLWLGLEPYQAQVTDALYEFFR